MAAQTTLSSIHRQPNRRCEAAEPIGLLSAAIVAGLALFGLATNGACLAATTQSGSRNLPQEPENSKPTGEVPETGLSLMTRVESRVASNRVPRCQY